MLILILKISILIVVVVESLGACLVKGVTLAPSQSILFARHRILRAGRRKLFDDGTRHPRHVGSMWAERYAGARTIPRAIGQ